MRHLNSLTVKGIPFFADQTFDFSKPGLSVILGLNLNTAGLPKGKGRGKAAVPKAAQQGMQNTNFVGKSLFFSQLFELFFKEGLSDNAKDRIKQGSLTVDMNVGKSNWVVTKAFNGKKESFTLIKDGKDVTPDNSLDACRLKAQQILGRTRDSFSVIEYLANGTPHLLRTGDTAARKRFFTEFFDLESADAIKKMIVAEKSRLRKAAAVARALQEELDKAQVTPKQLRLAKKDAQALASELQEVSNELQRLQADVAFQDFCSENKAVRQWMRECGVGKSVVAASDWMRDMKTHVDRLQTVVALTRQRIAYVTQMRAMDAALAARRDYFKKHGLTAFDKGKARVRIKTLNSTLDALKEQAAAQDSALALAKEALRVKRRSHQSILDAIEAAKGSSATCARCGQVLDKEHRDQEATRLRKELKAAQRELEEAKEAYDAATDAKSKSSATQHSIGPLTEELEGLTRQLDLLSDAPALPEPATEPEGNLVYDAKQALDSLPGFPLPSSSEQNDLLVMLTKSANKVPTEEGLSVLSEAAHTWKSRLATVKKACDSHFWKRFVTGASSSSDEALLNRLTDQALDLTEKMAQANALVMDLERRLTERQELEEKIKGIEADLSELDVLDVLDKAFASNAGGVTQLMINSICRTLEARVNKYAKTLFPEDYVFEFDLATQFHITCTRQIGSSSLVSDVRKLSGAEAGMFNLLLAISLMTFLPPAKRLNFMVLDELNANFGPEVNDAFIRFLPVLNKAVPHIVVITPRSGDNYGETARYFTVVKEGDQSSILPGRFTQKGAS